MAPEQHDVLDQQNAPSQQVQPPTITEAIRVGQTNRLHFVLNLAANAQNPSIKAG